MKIALLGAESTGKTQLALALATHLSQAGFQVHLVSEYLREWCAHHQRTPQQDEQHHIANTQMMRVMNAPPNSVVIADTTALMTAVYSHMVFEDHSLDHSALAHQRIFDVNLLTGLDIEWVSDGIQRSGPHVREPVDQRVRHLLAQAGLSYQVVYGLQQDRLHNALYGIARQAPHWANALKRQEQPPRWSGTCDNCADPDCEHRLFTSLLKD
jgi:nicotinamide riboside kinase